MSFKIQQPGRVTSLSGWKKSYRLPENRSSTSNAFAIECAAQELKSDRDSVYKNLREHFGFTRREMQTAEPEGGVSTITTPHFSYSIAVSLDPNDLDTVIWARTVSEITANEQIATQAFGNVFDNVFDTIELALHKRADVGAFIDAIEAAKIAELKIDYDPEATYCKLQLGTDFGTVLVTPQTLSIVHGSRKETQQLIQSFEAIQKLIEKHRAPLIEL